MQLYSSTLRSLEIAFEEAQALQESNAWHDEDEAAMYLLVGYLQGVIDGTVDSTKLATDLQEI